MDNVFLGISLIEWFGYLASVIVAVSLVMGSIVKLRWYNLIGAGMFSTYGFLIGALPVGVLNAFIVIADIYYLIQIYKKEEHFDIIKLDDDSKYLKYFLNYKKDDIKKYFPDFDYGDFNGKGFYLIRDLTPVGIIYGIKDEDIFEIKLDYILPEYRDFKMGSYVFENHIDIFKNMGVNKLITESQMKDHNIYLEKMGFKLTDDEQKRYVKHI
ncbi:MAG: hypothetical protein ACQERZ_02410 [Fusobacteriota bacterium]